MVRQPYRVLHLVDSPERRGAELFAVHLAETLEGETFQNSLCSLHHTPYGDEAGLPVNLPQYLLGGNPKRWKATGGMDPKVVYGLVRTVRRLRPDIVLAHGGKTLKYGGMLKLASRRPRVVYKNIGTASYWAKSPFSIAFNKLALKGFDMVVSVSDYTRRDFIQLYNLPESRVVTIPSGISAAQFDGVLNGPARAEVRQELGIGPTDLVLVSVGSLSPEKCPGELVRMMADLWTQEAQCHLVMVGDGPQREELESAVRDRGLTSRVHLVGLRSDVPRLLSAADIFVLPSQTEGMPSVVIEAGLAGLPTVAYDVGGVGDAVRHGVTGCLVPAGDYPRFVQAVLSMTRDLETSRNMGRAARQFCLDRFEMDKVTGRYRQLFLGLLESEAGPRPLTHSVR